MYAKKLCRTTHNMPSSVNPGGMRAAPAVAEAASSRHRRRPRVRGPSRSLARGPRAPLPVPDSSLPVQHGRRGAGAIVNFLRDVDPGHTISNLRNAFSLMSPKLSRHVEL